MLQRQTRDEASQSQWRLIASDGDLDVRVRQDMRLGETAAGTLSLDPADARLSLEISTDGDLIIHAADGYELSTPESSHSRRELVPRHQRAEVRLASHLLRFNTPLVDETVPAATIDIQSTAAAAPQGAPPPEDAAAAAGGRAAGGRDVSLKKWFMPEQQPRPDEPPKAAAASEPEPAREREPQPIAGSQDRQPAADRRTHSSTRLGALAGLAGVAMVAAFLLFGEGQSDGPSFPPAQETAPDPVERPPRATSDPAGEPAAISDTSAAEPLPAANPQPVLQPLSVPDAADPPRGAAEPQETTGQPERSVAAAAEPEPEVTIEPVVIPEVPRRSPPEPATDQPVAAAPPPPARPSLPKPNPAQVAVLERIGRTATALAEELAQHRNRLAADLALRQGRLVTPPEDNALALYQRVLESNPQSSEALAGLQSVRQALINRTLALLAADALGDARQTLEAAERAGANPMLIENLRGEVEYRERRAGDAADGTPGGTPR